MFIILLIASFGILASSYILIQNEKVEDGCALLGVGSIILCVCAAVLSSHRKAPRDEPPRRNREALEDTVRNDDGLKRLFDALTVRNNMLDDLRSTMCEIENALNSATYVRIEQ